MGVIGGDSKWVHMAFSGEGYTDAGEFGGPQVGVKSDDWNLLSGGVLFILNGFPSQYLYTVCVTAY